MTKQFPTYSIKGKEVEYKTVTFLIKSVDQDQGIVTGLASPVQNIDHQKDVVEPGAYTKTLGEAKARMDNGRRFMYATLWMHSPEQPTGGVIASQETADGLSVTMKYDISVNAVGIPNNPTATMVFSGFKVGYVDELSIGYIAVKFDYDKGGVRHLREIQLIEISAVTMLFAANPEALVPASGVKSIPAHKDDSDGKRSAMNGQQGQQQRKDFDDLYQAAQAADTLEDWGDLINTLTQAMMQLFCMGDQPQADMTACLDQFNKAILEWVDKGMQCGLAEYLNSRYGGNAAPYVPYSLRVGDDWGYMARRDKPSSKVGATISAATQGTLEDHQTAMKASLDAMQDHCKTMQQKVDDLTQLWQDEGQGPAYNDDNDGKSRTRREPPRTLTREQPHAKSTAHDLTIDELASIL